MFLLLAAGVLFSGCSVADLEDAGPSGWNSTLQVYFSDPGITPSTGTDRGLPEKIGDLIRSAKKSVDVNIYELTVPAIYQAMIDMHKKGVNVRMVGDIDNTGYEGYQALAKANVPMRLGNPDKIMHNKFVVVDDYYVTMGSMNFTGSGALMNNENVVFLRSSNVAAYYKKEFDNMYKNGAFGLDKQPWDGFTNNRFTLESGIDVEVYFTPYVNAFAPKYSSANDRILEVISNAQHSIYFAMFAYTSVEIAQAMIYKATNDGVKVFGAFDKGWNEASEWSVYQLFVDAGVNIIMDGNEHYYPDNPYHGAKIHNKYMVVDHGYDSAVTFTGSFNFSPSAALDGNDENCMFIFDKGVTAKYAQNFMDIYRIGNHPTRSLGGDKAAFHDVMISEINWAGSMADDKDDNYRDKFVELKNMTDKPINISGWQLWGLVNKIYRVLGHIFPKNTVIPANGHLVLYYSLTGSAFDYTTAYGTFDKMSEMYNSSGQNYVNLTLKDPWQNIVDKAGAGDKDNQTAPFAGEQGTTQYASMVRIGPDGTLAASWQSCTNANQYVKSGYKTRTLATPGTD